MKKIITTIFALIYLFIFFPSAALAQEEPPSITLTLTRDFGYGGFSGDIQGTFSMKVSGPDNLVKVQFYIDELLIGTDTEIPFLIQFHTESFEPGNHNMYAIGILSDGSEVRSNEFIRHFLSGEDAMGNTLNIVIPLLAVILGISIIGVVAPMLFGKKGKLRPVGEYGAAGGAVCPRCQLPYSRNYLSPNLVIGKLEHCPHCGKWAVVRRAAQDELVDAEARLRQDREEGVKEISKDEDESLRQALEDSRFDD
jgi:hypothetical protein